MNCSELTAIAPAPPAVSAANAPLLTVLSSTFGSPFQLWDETRPLPAENIAAVEQARRHGSATHSVAGERVQIWIELPGRRNHRPLAVGTVTSRDPQMLDLLVQAARKLIAQDRTLSERSADVESCLESLTYGLEEQTWLRSLTSHLTLCSLRHTWHDAARAILPTLRSLVRADSLIVVVDAGSTNAIQTDPLKAIELEFLCDGQPVVDNSYWQKWSETRAAKNDREPVVQNGPVVDADLQGHRVHALCAIPIIHHDHHFGWIIAVKRLLTDAEGVWKRSSRLSEEEFGTIEAGLIEAAASMLATHRSNVDLLQDRENLTVGIIRAMGHAIDARDPYTRGHSERVGRYGRLLARTIGLSCVDCDRLYLSGLLHDVGKIGIPDTVLQKPGKLTDEEFAIIKQHPEIGARIVSTLPQLANLLPGILHHHENIDGTGYPHGLVGESIPLMGRILAVADAYDAMTSDRPYRKGMPRERAAEILSTNAGTQWDEPLVKAFLAIPVEQLILDAFERADGWHTDEASLHGGTAALFGSDESAIMKHISRDNLPPVEGDSVLP